MAKPVFCVDLDGVLLKQSCWFDISVFGVPIDGAVEFVKLLKSIGTVTIFTCRCKEAEAHDKEMAAGFSVDERVQMVKNWLDGYGIPFDHIYTGRGKPLADFYIDDRAICCQPEVPDKDYWTAMNTIIEMLTKGK